MIGARMMYEGCIGCPSRSCDWPGRKIGSEHDFVIDGRNTATNESPFDIAAIYHDEKFTHIKTMAPEKFSIYEMKDGKPNLVPYQLQNGTYVIPKVMDSGYFELGKKRMDFTRKG